MMQLKYSHAVHLQPPLNNTAYTVLFTKLYNTHYLNSFAIQKEYEQDSLGVRRSSKSVVIFHGPELSIEQVESQVEETRKLIFTNLSLLIDQVEVAVEHQVL